MGLTKLSAKCRSCPFVDKCNNKRMEGHGYFEMNNIAAPSIEPSSSSFAEPMLRETVTIMINGKPNTVYKDEIEKQLYEQLYSELRLQYGG